MNQLLTSQPKQIVRNQRQLVEVHTIAVAAAALTLLRKNQRS
jgi:hypothetical protein